MSPTLPYNFELNNSKSGVNINRSYKERLAIA